MQFETPACTARPACEHGSHAGRHRLVCGCRGIEYERAVIAEPIAVHVASHGRCIRRSRAHRAEPVDADQVERVVAQIVRDLVTGVEVGAAPLDFRGIADRARESAKLFADVCIGVAATPAQPRAEAERRHAQTHLPTHGIEIGPLLGNAGKLRYHARIAAGDAAGEGKDAGGQYVHGPVCFIGQREPLHPGKVAINEAALISVVRIRGINGGEQPIVQHRAAPLQIRTDAPRGAIVLREQRHVWRAVGEHRAGTAVGTSIGNGAQVRVRIPVGDRRGRAGARELLHRARQAGIVDGTTDKRGLRRVLKHANPAAHNGTRSAKRAGEGADLFRSAVRP